MKRDWVIEKWRDGDAHVHEAHPVQVAEDHAMARFLLRGLDEAHLRTEIAPGLTVVNNPIDPGPELRIHRRAEFALPPKGEGKIGVELRENDVREERA